MLASAWFGVIFRAGADSVLVGAADWGFAAYGLAATTVFDGAVFDTTTAFGCGATMAFFGEAGVGWTTTDREDGVLVAPDFTVLTGVGLFLAIGGFMVACATTGAFDFGMLARMDGLAAFVRVVGFTEPVRLAALATALTAFFAGLAAALTTRTGFFAALAAGLAEVLTGCTLLLDFVAFATREPVLAVTVFVVRL